MIFQLLIFATIYWSTETLPAPAYDVISKSTDFLDGDLVYVSAHAKQKPKGVTTYNHQRGEQLNTIGQNFGGTINDQYQEIINENEPVHIPESAIYNDEHRNKIIGPAQLNSGNFKKFKYKDRHRNGEFGFDDKTWHKHGGDRNYNFNGEVIYPNDEFNQNHFYGYGNGGFDEIFPRETRKRVYNEEGNFFGENGYQYITNDDYGALPLSDSSLEEQSNEQFTNPLQYWLGVGSQYLSRIFN